MYRLIICHLCSWWVIVSFRFFLQNPTQNKQFVSSNIFPRLIEIILLVKLCFDYRSDSFYILFILHWNGCVLNKVYLFCVVGKRMFNQMFISFQHQLIEIAKIFCNMQYRKVLQNEMSRDGALENFPGKSHIKPNWCLSQYQCVWLVVVRIASQSNNNLWDTERIVLGIRFLE